MNTVATETRLPRHDGAAGPGERAISFDAGAMGRLRKELIWTLGEERARAVLTRFGYAMGYAAAVACRDSAEDDATWIGGAQVALHANRLARIDPETVRYDRLSGTFEYVAQMTDSFEVHAHLSHLPPGFSPKTCWIVAGYLSGFATAFLGGEVYFDEERCAVMGGGSCRIVGRSAGEWGAERALELSRLFEEENVGTELTVVYDELERKNRLLEEGAVLVAEIASHKAARDDAETSLAILKAQQEATPDAILIVDLEGKVLSYNTRFQKLLDVPPELLQRGRDHELLAAIRGVLKDPDAFLSLVQHLYAHPLEVRREDTVELKNGKIISRDSSPVLLTGGQPIARAWYFRDITNQRRLEGEYRHAQKMDAIGTLAGGIAHDFNNLLTAIRGYVELALNTMEPSSRAHQGLKTAAKAAARAAELTRALLNFSRQAAASPQPLDLQESIEETVRLLRRTIDPRITIETSSKAGLWLARADPGQMVQVLTNLCVNARDAMPEGGRITLRTDNVAVCAGDALSAAGRPVGEYVLLAVSDNGAGMTAEVQARMFEPFFTTKETGKGTGLGLAMVYGIIQQQNGWIDCTSAPGEGTTFRIHLPRDPGTARPREAERTISRPGGNETILIIEDDPMVRDLAASVLESLGYTVLTAIDGVEGLEVFRGSTGVKLVILDLLMPRRSGHDVFTELRSADPTLSILISSGFSSEGAIEELVEKGASGTLNKPYLPDDLARTVRETLDRAAGSERIAAGSRAGEDKR